MAADLVFEASTYAGGRVWRINARIYQEYNGREEAIDAQMSTYVSQKRPDESEVCIVLYGMGVSRCWLHDDVASLLRLTACVRKMMRWRLVNKGCLTAYPEPNDDKVPS